MKRLYALFLVSILMMNTALQAEFSYSSIKLNLKNYSSIGKRTALGAAGTTCLYFSLYYAALSARHFDKVINDISSTTDANYYHKKFAKKGIFALTLGIIGSKLIYEAIKTKENKTN